MTAVSSAIGRGNTRGRSAKGNLRHQLRRTGPGAAVGLTCDVDGYGLCVDLADELDRHYVPTSVDGYEVRVRVIGPVTAGHGARAGTWGAGHGSQAERQS